MEGCRLLTEARELVERSEMREWRIRHSRNQLIDKKEKGLVEPAKEKEKEEDKLERFFCHLYEFHNPVPTPVPAPVPTSTATTVPVSHIATAIPVFPVGSAQNDFSIISSVNFVVPLVTIPVSSPSSCIDST